MAVTWNPSDKSANVSLTNSNLTGTSTVAASFGDARATKSFASGKIYFEVQPGQTYSHCLVGMANASASLSAFPGSDGNGFSWGFSSADNLGFANGGNASFGYAIGTGWYGIAVDIGNGLAWIFDGVHWNTGYNSLNTGDPVAEVNGFTYTLGGGWVGGALLPVVSLEAAGGTVVLTANFGQQAPAYTLPVGYSWVDPPVVQSLMGGICL